MTGIMASREVPILLPKLIQKIALFLPLPDVSRCMQVCKLWKELLSSEQFYKRYVLSHFNLELEEQPSGLLNMWTDPDNWFCYWARRGDPNYWVFADPPKRWKCGVVHSAEYELETHRELRYKDFCRALYILSRIQKAAEPEELRLDCMMWGNEGVGLIETCLFPWSKDSLPSAQDMMSMFHFNPEMHKNPMEKTDIRGMKVEGDVRGHVSWNTLHTSYDVDIRKACSFFEWLQQIFSPCVRIGIGLESMNPIPCFILTHIAPGWVGGILSCSTCT